jgi:hypothetical protein
MDGSSKLVLEDYSIDNNPAGPGDLLRSYLSATDQFVLWQLYSQAIMTQQPLNVSSTGRVMQFCGTVLSLPPLVDS